MEEIEMAAETSKLKPENLNRRPDPNIGFDFNSRSEKSFSDNGFSVEDFKTSQEKTFLSQVDLRKGPIERTVTKIVRLKAVDYSTEKLERKEYLYYFENWTGVNWLGIPVAPVTDHVEGMYNEALKETVFSPTTGDPVSYKYKGTRSAYYIPFEKKKVDEIIKNSAHSNQDSILYVVKFSPEDATGRNAPIPTRGAYSYDQFVNLSFRECYELNKSPLPGQQGNNNITTSQKSLYK
jgi:hypothetical protein